MLGRVLQGFRPRVSLPLNRYGKVAADCCLDQGATKEYSPRYMSKEQRRAGQKDQNWSITYLAVMTRDRFAASDPAHKELWRALTPAHGACAPGHLFYK